jgi:mono/diheme cytochrome c family protein
MRRPVVALLLALAALGFFTGGLAWLLDDPRPRRGASAGERIYYAYCVTCHGVQGRGSWRATLSLLRPGDLTDATRMREHSDSYLFELIKHGGSPIGRPGMPGSGHALSDQDIEALVQYVRTLSAGER